MSDNKEQYVGTAIQMPGTSGFTMACFNASEVPVGTKLYVAAQSVVLSDEDILRIAGIHYRPEITSEEFSKAAGGFIAAVRAILAAKEQA